jgi:hypothetical protein
MAVEEEGGGGEVDQRESGVTGESIIPGESTIMKPEVLVSLRWEVEGC